MPTLRPERRPPVERRVLPHLYVHPLFRGARVAIQDVRCCAPASPCGPDEPSSANQLVFTRRGVFARHTGAGARQAVIADSTRALFFNAGEVSRIRHPTAGGDVCTSFTFASDAAAEVAACYDPAAVDRAGRPFPYAHAPVTSAVVLRYHRLRRALAAGSLRDLAVEEEALALLHAVIGAGAAERGERATDAPARIGARAARRHREAAEAVRERLAGAPGEAHTLGALARAVDVSPFHLARVFHRETGVPIHQYLLQLRLAVAVERLGDGTPVGTLALDLGFSSHSHFTTLFRQRYGVSPREAGRMLAGRGASA
jgi:AraC family transcriptional regulator